MRDSALKNDKSIPTNIKMNSELHGRKTEE